MKTLNQTVLKSPVHFIAFGFGAGLSPKAPGTVGTAASIPIIVLANWLGFPLFILFLLTTLLGVWISGESSKRLGVHDHPGIVIDEFAGMMLTLLFVPLNIYTIIIGFALFRFFDILKPWPIRAIDKQVHGGLGIMLDDLLAGVYAAVLLWIGMMIV